MPDLKCPNCISTEARLVVVIRQDIEIDHCPFCRGVWLDRGELDKIIAHAAIESAPVADGHTDELAARRAHARQHREDHVADDPHPRRRRPGVLGELFDFSSPPSRTR